MKPRVFLLEEAPWLDIEGAKVYGQVVVIFDRKARRPSMFSPPFQKALLRRLEDERYRPGFDYLLIAGKVALCSILVGACAAKHGVANLIVFCASDREYTLIKIGDDNG